eukprot:CAMPEP_0198523782 /NCGR_PEP_ID=MMETSP1462-20131121/22351_1 /TAXON_ID=1333877 /ORGANISM="Brandtodinium nutriculum, Strain RCC3387" /LENGTH=309 /DNA_ID=CAMNT_0044253491 /DNA_START=1 /DNA_END=927 /DNA_ORIENTATION=+
MLRCSHADVVRAVRSLYADELTPAGYLLLKRLREHAAAATAAATGVQEESIDPGTQPRVDPRHLRRLCENSDVFQVSPERAGEYSVRLAGWVDTFVDLTSSVDPYPIELWEELEAYFDAMQADRLGFSGGRYACARALAKLELPCLNGLSFGKICHIVKLAICDRFLLGYRSGNVVPFRFSERCSKVSMALARTPMQHTALHAASMEEARAGVWQLLNDDEHGSIVLSNVKRLFRARFGMELSETALGYERLRSLLFAPCFRDICAVEVTSKGREVIRQMEARPWVPSSSSLPAHVLVDDWVPISLRAA